MSSHMGEVRVLETLQLYPKNVQPGSYQSSYWDLYISKMSI